MTQVLNTQLDTRGGAGKSRLLADFGKEQAGERRIYDKQVRDAEGARRVQAERKSAWSTFGKAIGSLFGPAGFVIGSGLGKFAGDIGTVGGKQAEDYDIDMDVGKFGVSEAYDYADAQRILDEADRGEKWRDLTDIGVDALTAFALGGGSIKDPGNFSFTQYGGKSAGRGAGIFGKGPGGSSVWDEWMGRTFKGWTPTGDATRYIEPVMQDVDTSFLS